MLTLFHTAASNVDVFDALLKQMAPDVQVKHIVDEAVLREAVAAGAVTPNLAQHVNAQMADVTRDGGIVLCTCSTIGGLAEATGPNVLRVDRPMAEKAVSIGNRIAIAATLKSTLVPTRELIEKVSAEMNKPVQISEWFLESAWPFMERGDKAGYFAEIARVVENKLQLEPVDVVVLAQASMAGAEPLCAHLGTPVFSSPRLGLEAALKRANLKP
jgi:hypothetical protein